MSPFGNWCSVWAMHGEPLNRREEIGSINLVEDGENIRGTFTWRNAEYYLSCKVTSGIFLTGTYEDKRGGRSFVGTFQLTMFPGNQTMGGKWLGFDMRNRVLAGKWEWRRQDVNHYPFERWGSSYFLSYAREDASIADHFEALLRRRHCVVLRDESRIGPGSGLSRAVSSDIAEAGIFLAIHSRAYDASEWCRSELQYARTLQEKSGAPRRILLVDLDGTEVRPPFTELMRLNGADRIARERAVFDIYTDPD